MTDPKCDLPGGFIDDWGAAGKLVGALNMAGFRATFKPGLGAEDTFVTVKDARKARQRVTVICDETLLGCGWYAKVQARGDDLHVTLDQVAGL